MAAMVLAMLLTVTRSSSAREFGRGSDGAEGSGCKVSSRHDEQACHATHHVVCTSHRQRAADITVGQLLPCMLQWTSLDRRNDFTKPSHPS